MVPSSTHLIPYSSRDQPCKLSVHKNSWKNSWKKEIERKTKLSKYAQYPKQYPKHSLWRKASAVPSIGAGGQLPPQRTSSCKRHQHVLRYRTRLTCNRWCQLTIMQMRARWSKSELNKRCYRMLSSVFIYPVQMHTVNTQILTDRLSWLGLKPVPTDERGFVNSTLRFRLSTDLP